jgi:hypothetical protein
MSRTIACSTALAALLLVTPQAQTGTTIRIWKVGSPQTGDTPSTDWPGLISGNVSTNAPISRSRRLTGCAAGQIMPRRFLHTPSYFNHRERDEKLPRVLH